ncbi:zinc-binding dehydrogenase [Streptomyces glomeratus]|uniref:zinc-binding dehydrogenase n=1 Tax=Streptomyces glomeratus TaxID=284452 RepID=UPI001F1E81B0|nr:zinc-binding dehydrogenase [Streptomyces glomeratus]MCF1507012.1 zinc-binding dehydrogenase [Streptomyces glomeratus]
MAIDRPSLLPGEVLVRVRACGGESRGRGGALRPGGVLVSILEDSEELLATAEALGMRFAVVSAEPDYAALEKIAELADAGKIRPYVEATFALADAAGAHAALDAGRVQGKLVLTI